VLLFDLPPDLAVRTFPQDGSLGASQASVVMVDPRDLDSLAVPGGAATVTRLNLLP